MVETRAYRTTFSMLRRGASARPVRCCLYCYAARLCTRCLSAYQCGRCSRRSINIRTETTLAAAGRELSLRVRPQAASSRCHPVVVVWAQRLYMVNHPSLFDPFTQAVSDLYEIEARLDALLRSRAPSLSASSPVAPVRQNLRVLQGGLAEPREPGAA